MTSVPSLPLPSSSSSSVVYPPSARVYSHIPLLALQSVKTRDLFSAQAQRLGETRAKTIQRVSQSSSYTPRSPHTNPNINPYNINNNNNAHGQAATDNAATNDSPTEQYLHTLWMENQAKSAAEQRLKGHIKQLIGQWQVRLGQFEESVTRQQEAALYKKLNLQDKSVQDKLKKSMIEEMKEANNERIQHINQAASNGVPWPSVEPVEERKHVRKSKTPDRNRRGGNGVGGAGRVLNSGPSVNMSMYSVPSMTQPHSTQQGAASFSPFQTRPPQDDIHLPDIHGNAPSGTNAANASRGGGLHVGVASPSAASPAGSFISPRSSTSPAAYNYSGGGGGNSGNNPLAPHYSSSFQYNLYAGKFTGHSQSLFPPSSAAQSSSLSSSSSAFSPSSASAPLSVQSSSTNPIQLLSLESRLRSSAVPIPSGRLERALCPPRVILNQQDKNTKLPVYFKDLPKNEKPNKKKTKKNKH